jgi:biopolymer transport protein ExbD
MGGGGGGSMESGEPEFQVAPMIDCLLVLLIFFMSITTAEVLQIDEDIKLPVASDAKKKEKSKTQEGALNVKWKAGKGVFNFMGKDYDDPQKIASALTKVRENIPGYRLVIRADKNLPAVEIQRTMSVLASAGYDTITFSTLNQE